MDGLQRQDTAMVYLKILLTPVLLLPVHGLVIKFPVIQTLHQFHIQMHMAVELLGIRYLLEYLTEQNTLNLAPQQSRYIGEALRIVYLVIVITAMHSAVI